MRTRYAGAALLAALTQTSAAQDAASTGFEHEAEEVIVTADPLRRADSHLAQPVAVLRGEIVLVTDKDEVVLKSGDTLVQTGNNHAWQNRTDEVAVLLVVVVGAQRKT